MTTHRCELWVCLAIALAGARPAWSDPAADAEAAYEEGRRLYDLREWDQAIAKFKEAYRLRPDAKSMFNIAQAERLKGDCIEAVNFYRTYKRNFPKEKNLDKVDKFIAELEPCAQKQGTSPPPTGVQKPPPPVVQKPPPPVAQKPPPVVVQQQPPPPVIQQPPPANVMQPPPSEPPPPTEPSRPGSGRRKLGAVLGIGGGMALVGGAYFGLQARSASNKVSDRTDVPWDQGLDDQGKSDDTKAKVLFAVGGVAAAIGVVVYVTAPKSQQTVGVVPQSGGAMITWAGHL